MIPTGSAVSSLGLTLVSSKSHKATKQQQRDRARRRAQRQEKVAVQRQAERKRTGQAVVVAVVALLVVAGIVLLSKVLGSTDDTTDASGSTDASGIVCTEPPAAPGTPATYELPDATEAEGRTYTAVVTPNCGDISVDLDGTDAPQSVASFLMLAEDGFYDDSPCHRLLASGNTVLQCGDPTGTGTGGPGYGYGVEYVPEDGSYPRGTLAMARTGDLEAGTGSQFFIVATDSVWPPSGGGYTIFGNVTSGMEIIDHIVDAGVTGGGADGSPAQPISILEIAVTEKKA